MRGSILTRSRLLSLIVALIIPLAIGAAAGYATAQNVATWYPALNKPAWTPPGWLFAPVWTLLYVFMGLASWLIWESPANPRWKKRALIFYGLQLVLNGGWSFLFFQYQWIGWALVEIVVLGVLVLFTTILFYRLDRAAGLLMVPYLLWISYAISLNAGIFTLN